MLKPKRERRPLPKPPTETPLNNTSSGIEEHNKIVAEAFEKTVMRQCQNCGRTFLEDRLAIHQRSCTADHPARAINQGASPTRSAQPVVSKPSPPKRAAPAQAKVSTNSGRSLNASANQSVNKSVEVARPQVVQQNAFCAECGHQFAASAKFCAQCGNKR